MSRHRHKSRDKKIQKFTRDGLVEQNLTTGETSHISHRESEKEFHAKDHGTAEVKAATKMSDDFSRRHATNAVSDVGTDSSKVASSHRSQHYTTDNFSANTSTTTVATAETRHQNFDQVSSDMKYESHTSDAAYKDSSPQDIPQDNSARISYSEPSVYTQSHPQFRASEVVSSTLLHHETSQKKRQFHQSMEYQKDNQFVGQPESKSTEYVAYSDQSLPDTGIANSIPSYVNIEETPANSPVFSGNESNFQLTPGDSGADMQFQSGPSLSDTHTKYQPDFSVSDTDTKFQPGTSISDTDTKFQASSAISDNFQPEHRDTSYHNVSADKKSKFSHRSHVDKHEFQINADHSDFSQHCEDTQIGSHAESSEFHSRSVNKDFHSNSHSPVVTSHSGSKEFHSHSDSQLMTSHVENLKSATDKAPVSSQPAKNKTQKYIKAIDDPVIAPDMSAESGAIAAIDSIATHTTVSPEIQIASPVASSTETVIETTPVLSNKTSSTASADKIPDSSAHRVSDNRIQETKDNGINILHRSSDSVVQTDVLDQRLSASTGKKDSSHHRNKEFHLHSDSKLMTSHVAEEKSATGQTAVSPKPAKNKTQKHIKAIDNPTIKPGTSAATAAIAATDSKATHTAIFPDIPATLPIVSDTETVIEAAPGLSKKTAATVSTDKIPDNSTHRILDGELPEPKDNGVDILHRSSDSTVQTRALDQKLSASTKNKDSLRKDTSQDKIPRTKRQKLARQTEEPESFSSEESLDFTNRTEVAKLARSKQNKQSQKKKNAKGDNNPNASSTEVLDKASGKTDAKKSAKQKKKTKKEQTQKSSKLSRTGKLKFSKEDEAPGSTLANSAKKGGKFVAATTASAASIAIRRKFQESEDDNVALEGLENAELLTERSVRQIKNTRKSKTSQKRTAQKKDSLFHQSTDSASAYHTGAPPPKKARKETSGLLNRFFQKQRQKKEAAEAVRNAKSGTKRTIRSLSDVKDAIFSGGETLFLTAKEFFAKHNKGVYSLLVLLFILMLLITQLYSCSSMFTQTIGLITTTSWPAVDSEITEAENYYTKLEANLQKRIDRLETTQSDCDEYNYNIGVIEHDPVALISYLCAKHGAFIYNGTIRNELDAIFNAQYQLSVTKRTETRTITKTVRAGERIGDVVTSGYCNCSICCGRWAGGATASGVMPTANHTIAVDAHNPTVPMGTEVIMNGRIYNANFSKESYSIHFTQNPKSSFH